MIRLVSSTGRRHHFTVDTFKRRRSLRGYTTSPRWDPSLVDATKALPGWDDHSAVVYPLAISEPHADLVQSKLAQKFQRYVVVIKPGAVLAC
jgi:hypothetical protein